jgi:EAL domain-containing protein (putative c-di-GMP-specific phosphodiesterase class I)
VAASPHRIHAPTSTGPAPDADWPAALARALTDPGAVTPAFQPIVDLRRGVVTGYEMLARFAGPPERGPDVWFREADGFGRRIELEALMVRAGMQALRALPDNCFLTINVDPSSLAEPQIEAALAERPSLGNLIIELTEHSLVDDDDLRPVLAALRERGVMFAIDDVGSGYSGLARIGALRPEFLKIDRSLVAGLHEEPARLEVVEMLGAVANRIDAWVIAEGIEEPEELEALIAIGVPLGQGFGLARPERMMVDQELPLTELIRELAADGEPAGIARGERLWTALDPLGAEGWEVEAARRFDENPGLAYLPVVNREGRPVGLVARHGLRRAAAPGTPLCTLQGENPARIAQRALARPAAERLAPVLCCDEQGRYLGPISIETLTETLARRLLGARGE